MVSKEYFFFERNKISMNEFLNRSYKVIAGIIVAPANTSISFKGLIKTKKKISSRLNCYKKKKKTQIRYTNFFFQLKI